MFSTNKNLIIVSNRLPFKIEKRNGKLEVRKSSGGLVSSMDSALQSFKNCTWVGAADFSEELWDEYQMEKQTSDINIVPVFLKKKMEKRYYNGFSNSMIWPLFHYFPSYALYKEDYYRAYEEVNEIFRQKIAAILQPADTVWIHDYHLMLLPRLLKQSCNNISLGFFLHIPFPSYEILKHIPEEWRSNILKGLLSADVIGFHTNEYAQHFQRSLRYFLGMEANTDSKWVSEQGALVKDYPISIDFEKFSKAFDEKAVQRGRDQIRKRYQGLKLIFSVDRLDYTKGVCNRLQAFEELLASRSELRQKVTFIINVVPSRDKHKKYAERRKLIEEQISYINGLYGNVHWTPIIYQYSHLSFQQLMSFYTSCDVALVTPLRDGMNLVAKEFVASRKDQKGVLVLSEFAGAASELSDSLLVNPNDIQMMKKVMLRALQMGGQEQSEVMQKMRELVKRNHVKKWTNDFLGDLNLRAALGSNRAHVTVLTREEELKIA